MRRCILAIGITGACIAWAASAAEGAFAAHRCVGRATGCYATIQAAVDASHDGDAITVAPGTYAGGVVITRSVSLTGSGAGATTIRGGGPVLTIGTLAAASEPAVSISGVRITGGRTTSSPEWDQWRGGGVVARGGGVFVPPGADRSPGATVSISRSVIAGNRVAPSATIGPEPDQVPFWPACPGGPCPYAGAEGGGIDNWGVMTVTDTRVEDNEAAGALTSDADGGGIWSAAGLTLTRSAVRRNRAVAVAPNARFTTGGGVFAAGGSLTISDSSVSDNVLDLSNTLPAFAGDQQIEMQSNGGGVFAEPSVSAVTIEGTRMTGNLARAFDPAGEPLAFDSALLVNDGPLTMRDTLIAGNRAIGTAATIADVGPGGSALEADGGGTITDTVIAGNPSIERSTAGDAGVNGALAVLNFSDHPPVRLTVRRSVIADNPASATTDTGTAAAQGGGIFNNALLDVERTRISGNTLLARGASGSAEEGGGIWNGVELSGPPVELRLSDSAVTGNVLVPVPGATRRGGGVFSTSPFTSVRSLIAGNRPDQCFGCGATAAAARRRGAAPALRGLRPARRARRQARRR